jgi:alpha-mannosidase
MSLSPSQQLQRDLDTASAQQRQLGLRFLAELEFAAELADLLGRKNWPKLIDQARTLVSEVVAAGRLERLPAAVAKAEALLAPVGKEAQRYTIHCVGHGHIDMNWMWSWPETVSITNDTFATVLRLMDEFDDFCFTQSQASVYQIIREHNPDMLDQIRRRVAEGRWEVAAAQWVEGDKNIASGESLARHLLYTRRFTQELFGLSPEDLPVEWEPDTFGHARTIPTIVSRGGVKCYYMCRGGNFAKPPVFWWKGPDDSRILVNLETTWYNGTIQPATAMSLLAFCRKTGLPAVRDWMSVFGVGDHGGGPTRRDICRAHEMNDWPIYPKFKFTTARKYFDILLAHGEQWPVLDTELNFEFAGCYTSQGQIKRHNRQAENELAQAESAATVAHVALGRAYPTEPLRQGWLNTLFGQFHDILPGSGVRATREYQSGLFQKTIATTSMTKAGSLRALAAEVDTAKVAGLPTPKPQGRRRAEGTFPARPESMAPGAGVGFHVSDLRIPSTGATLGDPWPFLVFNPAAWTRTEVVTATVWDSAAPGAAKVHFSTMQFVVRLPDGSVIPAQPLASGSYWGHEYVDLAFPVTVGPLGYATCVVEEGTAPAAPADAPASGVKFAGYRRPEGGWDEATLAMENEFLSVAFDPTTGGVSQLVDKATGCNLADPANPLGVLEFVMERTSSTAWVIANPSQRICPLKMMTMEPSAKGPHIASVVGKFKLNDSTLTVTYSLKAGQPGLEIAVTGQWLERGAPDIGTPTLRMQFPLALADAQATYEVPFGSIQRSLNHGEEVPTLRWADVAGTAAKSEKAAGAAGPRARLGCALLNDCRSGQSLTGAMLRVTLVRSTFAPDPLPEIGEHVSNFAVVPHSGAMEVADLVRLGAAFNLPMQVVATTVHAGRLAPAGQAVASAGPANIVLAGVKKAEPVADDAAATTPATALIFRFQETAGRDTVAKVQLDPALFGSPREAVETDLLERPLAESSAKLSGGNLTVRVPAYGIATVKVSL